MGEMANWVNEMGETDEWDSFVTGHMTIEEACDKGIINELGGEECGLVVRKCRYCGKSNLHWAKHNEGWRLFEGNQPHECKEYEKKKKRK